MHEVANSLWKAVKRLRIPAYDATVALQSLVDLQIELYEFSVSDVSVELSLANKIGITCYDAAYVALSEKNRVTLITADEFLYKATKEGFRVMHLKDYV